MTENQQLDDYVAAMHALVEDSRSLQDGRRAFAEALQALDELVAEQHEISKTLSGQHEQLRDAASVLEAQDVDSLAMALREHYTEYQQRLSDMREVMRASESSTMARQDRVEERLADAVERLKDVNDRTREQGENAVHRHTALERLIGETLAANDNVTAARTAETELVLVDRVDASEQATSARLTSLESAISTRIAELEKRIATMATLLYVILAVVVVTVIVAFIR